MRWLAVVALIVALPSSSEAKGYSSGGGRSYSSSSSHSSSFSSGRSSSGSSSSSSFGSSRSPAGGSGKSYSSGSTWSGTGRSYSSGKSYSAASDHSFSSHASGGSASTAARKSDSSTSTSARKPDGSGSAFTFDSSAARARKEETSRQTYTQFRDSQSTASGGTYRGPAPPVIRDYNRGSYRTPTYVPDVNIIVTRPARVHSIFSPYYSRPVVVYQDPYSSFFWWWLLDRSLEDRAYWAYHHRYDMDPGRYQSLLATDAQLETRVAQLEAQQVARDPHFVPTGLDQDLMYSDNYVNRAYQTRPTVGGQIAFWVFGVPTALAVSGFLLWLIWFKRW